MSDKRIEQQLVYALRGALGAGMSLRDVEVASGVSFNTLGRWAREGAHSRTLDGLHRLAGWLGLEIKLVRKSNDVLARLPARMRPRAALQVSDG